MTRRLLAVLVALFAAAPTYAQRVDLRPKLEPGQEFRFLLTQSIQQNRDADDPDQAIAYTMAQEMVLLFRVTTPPERDSRAATLEMTIEAIRFNMDTNGNAMSYDSAAPDDDNSFGTLLGPLLDAVFEIALDADGNITAVDRTDADAASNPFTDQLIGADLLTARLGPILTLKQGDGRATVGEYWTTLDEFKNSPIGPHQLVTRHRLVKHRRSVAEIETSGRLIATSEGASMPLDVEYEGTYLWDTKQGMLKSLDIEYTLDTDLALPDGTHTNMKTEAKVTVEQQ